MTSSTDGKEIAHELERHGAVGFTSGQQSRSRHRSTAWHLFNQRTRPNVASAGSATETVSGDDADKRCDWRGNASTVIRWRFGEVEFMALLWRCWHVRSAACGWYAVVAWRDLQLWRVLAVHGAAGSYARTMILKPFRRFSFATVRTPAGRWTGLLASRSASASLRLRRRHLPLHSGACDAKRLDASRRACALWATAGPAALCLRLV